MKLAIIGDPVEHSKSPEIHAALLRDAGIAGTSEAIRVCKGETGAVLRDLRARGFRGCNVTFPLKEEAAAACDRLMPAAERAGAANTILFGENETVGTTTDGAGAAAALRVYLGQLFSRAILVLGSGPTARAAIGELVDGGARVSVWARDAAKVEALAERFEITPFAFANPNPYAAFSALVPEAALPEGLVAALVRAPLVMDANYGERSRLGAQLGRRVIDGTRMLEEQARASFAFWLEGPATGLPNA